MQTAHVRRICLAALLVLLVGVGLDAGQAPGASTRRLELADFYRLESVGSPAISPDGRSVAFVRTFTVEDENRRHGETWLASTDGSSAPTRISSAAFSSSAPRFSPDGSLLAFTSHRPVPGGADSSIWFLQMDRPGGEAFQIAGVTATPIFSPDNQWIAFVAPASAGPKSKPSYATDFDRRIAERFSGRAIDWMQYRVDGRGYVPDPRNPSATPPQELYIVARTGGTPRQLTTLGVTVGDVAWRPDSRALAFVANTHQRDEHLYERSDLWTVTLDGKPNRLTDDGYDHSAPAWSPDGRALVFRRQQGLSAVIAAKASSGAPIDLYRMPAEGGPMENLTKDWDMLPASPLWSPDGRFVCFSGGVGGATHLFKTGATGGSVEQITRGDRELASFTFSATFDRVAYTAADARHPPEIFVGRLEGARVTDERQLSAVTDPLTRVLDVGRTDRVSYRSKDGTPIEGWVTLPPGYDPAKGAYPMIVSIHGGPHGAYGPAFSFPFQLLAANGYIVLSTNPRGSTGYGEKFLWGTWGGWGNLDYEDVMAGVHYVATKYPVDPKRLGVTGYSYGGFLTNWIITKTTRFAAAASGAGVSNWISDYGTADIPRTKESEFFGSPWEPKAAALLLEQSPIMHAGSVTTPTLFVHGESDARVPIEQAEQMYLALVKRRVPAKFVRYPDTFHGGWTPWNTVHRYDQELKWWKQYLQPGGTGTRN